jgi:UDP-N-acetylmuramyl tripeptide synthase
VDRSPTGDDGAVTTTARPPRPTWRTRAAVRSGQAAALASRLLGRGAGQVVGGKVVLRLAPDSLGELAAGHWSVLVSGTNGKTTTTRLVSAALSTRGPVASNSGGANMVPGVVTALGAAPPGAAAALEVDELHLPVVATAVRPEAVALLNLSRDQLDRASETRRIAALWRRLGEQLPGTTAVANADDPLVTWAAQGFADVVWVGAGQVWTSDAMVCPSCAALLRRGEPDAAGSADWSCPRCGLSRPTPSVRVLDPTTLELADGTPLRLDLRLPGRCNTANAAVAVAVAQLAGIDPEVAGAALQDVEAVAGRYAVVDLGGRRARLLLAKNPAGWVEMLELLELTPDRPVVISFNAREADGKDPSWIWDVPAERLRGRPVLVAGDRAEDVVLRLAHAGVEAQQHPSVTSALAAAPGGPDDVVDVLATYTAFRDLLLQTGLLA